MKRSDLEKKNLGELKKIARQKNVKGYSKYRKSDIQKLIDLIINYKSNKPKKRSRSKSKPKKRSRSKSKPKKRSRSKSKPKMSKYDHLVLPGTTKKLSEMKVSELKKYAKEVKIKRYSNKPKSELIKMIGIFLNKTSPVKNVKVEFKLPLNDEQVKNLKKKDMIDILKDNGVIIGLPNKKSELIKLLQQNKCSPIDNKYCDNNDICDIRNNICMSPNFKKRGLVKITMNGKEIIGTKKAIDNLSKQIKNSPIINNNIFEANNNDVIDIIEDKEVIGIPEDKINILSDDEIEEIELLNDENNINNLNNLDVEESLEEIEEPELDDELKSLSVVQKEVLKCLGMYPNVK